MRRFAFLILVILSTGVTAFAQPDSPLVIANTEYDIGLECPRGQALSPDATTLWVLMQGCFTQGYSLAAFNVADGTRIESADEFRDQLAVIGENEIYPFSNAVAFTPDGDIRIVYIDNENYAPHSLLIALDGGDTTPVNTDEAIYAMLAGYDEYTEAALYNADHTQAALLGGGTLNVIDLATGDLVFSLPVEGESFNAFPSFSPDGKTLYVAQLLDVDDYDNYNSTLTSYSLPDGAVLGITEVPSNLLWISPDGRRAAANFGSSDGTSATLFIVDLITGAVSEPIALYEPSRPLMACVNDGRSMAGVDFKASGRLYMYDGDWLPDGSAFVFTRSYGGEAAGGGRPCAFNNSRLNRLDIRNGE